MNRPELPRSAPIRADAALPAGFARPGPASPPAPSLFRPSAPGCLPVIFDCFDLLLLVFFFDCFSSFDVAGWFLHPPFIEPPFTTLFWPASPPPGSA